MLRTLTPALSHGERESYGQVGETEAEQAVNPAIPNGTRKETLPLIHSTTDER